MKATSHDVEIHKESSKPLDHLISTFESIPQHKATRHDSMQAKSPWETPMENCSMENSSDLRIMYICEGYEPNFTGTCDNMQGTLIFDALIVVAFYHGVPRSTLYLPYFDTFTQSWSILLKTAGELLPRHN